ncbi:MULTISPECIES: glycoside hydrolase family 65 protein [unclassified Robiginitalea]|uniref:glycoside hydrolase family 65 protein n=1 Tax=Robiginitalea TaxID=252306 RepID=UPI00234B0280|nr:MULTISPECIES: glycoside hydrolase family 65 protein [unclassified Robiginitalea]MDC6352848.1 glycoside hydrolase family 65 protein [Robiginitalea sp. PM2]MDC6373986.1 glycoside hydrolase family 65 protein [Robiginitalea sp. SP8]
MNQDYIVPDPWSIIEDGYEPDRVKSSESLFSLGNGAMGQRANFEETYSGPTFQGSYIGGVYYPDKTRVGWWKNGYPEYFAKVLNAPNWIGIDIHIDGEPLDLATCSKVENFRRELNMQEGVYYRSFEAELPGGTRIAVKVTRFLSMEIDEVGAIRYAIQPLNRNAAISFEPYLDGGITNEDTNWDDPFWEVTSVESEGARAYIGAHTLKTHFDTCTFMHAVLERDGKAVDGDRQEVRGEKRIGHRYTADAEKGQELVLYKFGGYAADLNHPKGSLRKAADKALDQALSLGFDGLKKAQQDAWARIWEMSDITIEGDVRAQQGIRFNILHLNQTYTGRNSRLNIGPKGFTGEKYGGSTYWDTEAYCIPFYMATKDQQVARQLLKYRYNHLEKAIENAEKLGFSNGAALYPMVTMNGEECHNEWEITFEEIHRNSAIAFAIFNYFRYTGDYSYIPEMGLEVLIGIARFWHQRATFSKAKNKYVILGVTGPNEYENNVNNNWYTNYSARWCIRYAIEQLGKVKDGYPEDYDRVVGLTKLNPQEVSAWKKVADNLYFPYSEEHRVYLQQDGFLDKELITVENLDRKERPINQKWSWDRILRSPYIKQADTLQGFYFFESDFSLDQLERHFDFYEPFTVHESSLSPCVHSIQAARLGRMEQAYTFYLRTSRLDLDDYNKEVHEGLHITSMAGTWMSIVEGFGGMRIVDDKLSFSPRIPKEWKSYSFKINFRHRIIHVTVAPGQTRFELDGKEEMSIRVNGKRVVLTPGQTTTV